FFFQAEDGIRDRNVTGVQTCALPIFAVTIAGIRLEITRTEWLVILLCFAMVLAAEAFNTAIERLVNLVSPDYHPVAGDVKDIAAGAVLICAIFAAIIGLIIFVPYF